MERAAKVSWPYEQVLRVPPTVLTMIRLMIRFKGFLRNEAFLAAVAIEPIDELLERMFTEVLRLNRVYAEI